MANNKKQLRLDGSTLGGIITTNGKNVRIERQCDVCGYVRKLGKCPECGRMICNRCRSGCC